MKVRSSSLVVAAATAAVLVGCTQDATVAESLTGFGGGTTSGPTSPTSTGSSGGSPTGDTEATSTSGSESSSESGSQIFDVGAGTGGVKTPQCMLEDDISGIGPCDTAPLAESFDATVQWSWGLGEAGSLTTPLVANLTDDNDDGSIDLCDTPDIIVLARFFAKGGGMVEPITRLVALDGETGEEHWRYEAIFVPSFGPALGDIDGDGLIEIVAVIQDGSERRLTAVSNEGELEWTSQTLADLPTTSVPNIALADLEGDGDVEILAGDVIADHTGALVRTIPGTGDGGFAVDLDADGDLEYVHSGGAHHHDGTPHFVHTGGGSIRFPQVADIDGDGLPEVVYSQHQGPGLAIYEHDGTLALSSILPGVTGLPGAIHDMNGDGLADLAVGHGGPESPSFSVIEFGGAPATLWTSSTVGGCCAGGTAFDFLGDTTAESIFADDQQLFVFDAAGDVLTTAPRNSPTVGDYPVVADVDNDGAAEIVVVAESLTSPGVQVLRDAREGWVPARRIWNQYHYHVTNIREDGTIPTVQPNNWEDLNTFRTQAQISAAGVCVPEG